jgi:hypothetical protein
MASIAGGRGWRHIRAHEIHCIRCRFGLARRLRHCSANRTRRQWRDAYSADVHIELSAGAIAALGWRR